MSATDLNDSRWDALADGAARVARGTVAGFLGGVVASWVMNRYQEIENRPVMVRRLEALETEVGIPHEETKPAAVAAQINGEEPTVKVAQKISRELFQHELTESEKHVAGPAVHYGYGGAVGALYGGLAEVLPIVGIGLGIPYATLLCLGGDAVAVPALGFSKPPSQVPPATHASALATHFVYGITLDISRRILRRML
jgi:uncharacterized membrane protein YagU involved in acid resistance